MGVRGRAKSMLNNKALHTLYHALVFPYLNYFVEVWGNTYKTILQPLCTLQKKSFKDNKQCRISGTYQ